MEVRFNNQQIQTEANTLQELLEEKHLSEKNGIAVAVNDRVIPKSDRQNYLLKNNDSILVITAAAGG